MVARGVDAQTWFETRGMRAPRALLFSRGAERERPGLGGLNGSRSEPDIALQERHELRVIGGMIERACHRQDVRRIVLASAVEEFDPMMLIEGMILRGYGSTAWREEKESSAVRKVVVCVPPDRKVEFDEALQRTLIVTGATNFARELGDLPGNLGTPAAIVEQVKARVEGSGLKVRTISGPAARKLGMGLFSAVDQGAGSRGSILILEHNAGGAAELPTLGMVGKGLTHDTGGYNIKTGHGVHELTHDKCGATAVIGAMLAIAELGVEAHVIGVCPLTENCVDAKAFKPGDILTAYDGTTVYVENTDAEGRLVLAVALAGLAEREPELMVDIATLTGASHSALGEPFAALFSNDDRARELLLEASRVSDDSVWPLPIHEIHDREIAHHKAELKNLGVQGGSACSAAAFLRHFVETPWAHLDIAGKAHTEFERAYYGPGATGFGCRLLVAAAERFAREWAP
jgi:leucyl aminopeptidase